MSEPVLLNIENPAQFSRLLFWGNCDEVIGIMEQYGVNANAVLPERNYSTLIEQVIHGCEQNLSQGQNNHYALTKYLLDNGADVTVLNKDGYSALHLAANDPKKIKYLELILEYPVPNINVKERSHGNGILFEFIRFVYARKADVSVSLKHRCLNIIEAMLKQGADPDAANRHGASARSGLKYALAEAGAIARLFEKYKDVSKKEEEINKSLVPETLQYPDIAKEIWKKLVPPSGPSDTVQGELLRSIEKLRDEAQRNGNINFGNMHKKMAQFLQKILLGSNHFTAMQKEEIGAYISVVSKKNQPYIDDDAYDYLTDRVSEFYMKEPALIPLKTEED